MKQIFRWDGKIRISNFNSKPSLTIYQGFKVQPETQDEYINLSMNLEYSIRPAIKNDLSFLQKLLTENGQKASIYIDERSVFYLAQYKDAFIGMIGAEISGTSALIRSTAVLNPWRNQGIAQKLVTTLMNHLREIGVSGLYLFSRDSGCYWQKFGFKQCQVQEVIDNLPDAPQVIGYLKDNSIWTDVAWSLSLD